MSVSINDIVVLRKKFELDRKKLQERENAVAIVEDMLREDLAMSNADIIGDNPTHTPKNGSQLDLPGTAIRAKGFAKAVRNAVRHFGSDSFTVPDIETLLKSQGTVFPKTLPRARISTILQKMLEDDIIDRIAKGKGSKPARYRGHKKVKAGDA